MSSHIENRPTSRREVTALIAVSLLGICCLCASPAAITYKASQSPQPIELQSSNPLPHCEPVGTAMSPSVFAGTRCSSDFAGENIFTVTVGHMENSKTHEQLTPSRLNYLSILGFPILYQGELLIP